MRDGGPFLPCFIGSSDTTRIVALEIAAAWWTSRLRGLMLPPCSAYLHDSHVNVSTRHITSSVSALDPPSRRAPSARVPSD